MDPSEEHINHFVEDVLQARVSLDEIFALSSEERERLVSLLDRGVSTPRRSVSHTNVRRDGKKQQYIEGYVRKTSYGFVEDQKEKKHVELAQQVVIPPFPIEVLHKADASVLRAVAESLSRKLKEQDFACLSHTLKDTIFDQIVGSLSKNRQEEIAFFKEKLLDEESNFADYLEEMPVLIGTYSMLTVLALKEGTQGDRDLMEALAEYEQSVESVVGSYCQDLIHTLGCHKAFKRLEERQWSILAGLIPRPSLVLLEKVLEKQSYDKLVSCLPARQQEELKEELVHIGNRHDHFVVDYERIEAVKKLYFCFIKL